MRLLDLPGERGIGAHAVQQRGHLGHGGSSRLVALRRHVSGLVPAGDGLEVAEVV